MDVCQENDKANIPTVDKDHNDAALWKSTIWRWWWMRMKNIVGMWQIGLSNTVEFGATVHEHDCWDFGNLILACMRLCTYVYFWNYFVVWDNLTIETWELRLCTGVLACCQSSMRVLLASCLYVTMCYSVVAINGWLLLACVHPCVLSLSLLCSVIGYLVCTLSLLN
jgi:hypothetical protein